MLQAAGRARSRPPSPPGSLVVDGREGDGEDPDHEGDGALKDEERGERVDRDERETDEEDVRRDNHRLDGDMNLGKPGRTSWGGPRMMRTAPWT